MPLLFGYDATHDSGAQPDHFDYGGTQKAQGPAFLGLGIQRSNMQVTATSWLAQTSRYAHPELSGLHMFAPLALAQECYKHLEGEGVGGAGDGLRQSHAGSGVDGIGIAIGIAHHIE